MHSNYWKGQLSDYENYIIKDKLAFIVTQLFQNFIFEKCPTIF